MFCSVATYIRLLAMYADLLRDFVLEKIFPNEKDCTFSDRLSSYYSLWILAAFMVYTSTWYLFGNSIYCWFPAYYNRTSNEDQSTPYCAATLRTGPDMGHSSKRVRSEVAASVSEKQLVQLGGSNTLWTTASCRTPTFCRSQRRPATTTGSRRNTKSTSPST